MKCDELNDQLVRKIIRDLSKGYGVEDISHRGTATQEQATHVLKFMRKHGLLDRFYNKKDERK